MKKILVLITLSIATSVVCLAQDRADSAAASGQTADQKGRTKIRIEALPDAVKQALEDEAFKGWMINAAFRDERKDQYEVELKNGVDRQVVKFNKDGKQLNK